jgi:hypothetical protein
VGNSNKAQCARVCANTGRFSATDYLIRKSSFLSLVPFISSRIQVGSTPLPVHFRLLFFLLWYFGFGLARVGLRGGRRAARFTPAGFADTWSCKLASWLSK